MSRILSLPFSETQDREAEFQRGQMRAHRWLCGSCQHRTSALFCTLLIIQLMAINYFSYFGLMAILCLK